MLSPSVFDFSLNCGRSGIQMRRTSWQDGVLGTNCPIPTGGRNFTYQFQVKDQIGSFFYAPSINMQRAAGGFGSFIVTNRNIIPIPFSPPDGDIVIIIGDWYTRSHKVSVSSCFCLLFHAVLCMNFLVPTLVYFQIVVSEEGP